MTVKSRKLEQSQATRAALIKTARKLFARVGYAGTDIETVARRTRVTRGALYHHFKDKQDLFSSVFDLEEQNLTSMVAQAAGSQSSAFDGMLAGCNAFLDACLDPAVQRIVLIDALAVLGWERWREIDAKYNLSLVMSALEAAMEQGVIARGPVEPLAHLLMGAITEAAIFIAHADDKPVARREVGENVAQLLSGLRIDTRKG
ncbi:MAG: TetR/AcrR family transcriptional regulator [Candidatus Binatus sp.]|uniref:TetR/AcrR family transcriptional regulator n=1 Tax=Candidatus Binatus sp. TaxID=2811406 RepID=UPI003BAE8210